MSPTRTLAVAAFLFPGVGGCGGSSSDGPPVLIQHGGIGESTLAACGERSNLEFAEVTATQHARVTSARLIGASGGLRAVDVLGYNGPSQTIDTKNSTPGLHGSHTPIIDTEASAVRLPDGVPISQDPKRPTALYVTVTSACSPPVASGHGKADLHAHTVEVTVDAGGRKRTQTLTGDIDICVGESAPEKCP